MPSHSQSQPFTLIGDTHADADWTTALITREAASGVHHLIQVGDFGYWPDNVDDTKFIETVNNSLRECGSRLWFVDGNHENHHRLATVPIDRRTGRRPVSERIDHLPRGYRWTVDGATWVAVGGAVSLDRDYRRGGTSWFPEEELSDDEATYIARDGRADVIVSHDAPWGVPTLYCRYHQSLPAHQRPTGWPVGALLDSDAHQQRLRAVVEALRPRLLIHGHHHHSYEDVLTLDDGTAVQIVGLGCNGQSGAARRILAPQL